LRWSYHRDVGYQPALPLALAKGYFDAIGVDLDVAGDDVDQFILHSVQHGRRDLDPVVNQDQL
jgi:hypothetical protein